ncbi:MAG TPA: metallophosphoesterase [Candidatus Anammoximicrobium sp.]|nr:metallophosphoesterase [Candidatus Anammoximicrobium sp.]
MRYTRGIAAAGAAGVLGYTFGIEPHWVEVVQRPLPVVALPASLVGRRLIQISDLHVGPRVDDAYIVHCLQTVAELKPDILLITGDLITYHEPKQLRQLREILTHLPKPRLASLAVLGNHDYGFRWSMPDVADDVAGELTRVGVQVLRNESAAVDGLTFAGVDDLWSGAFAPERALSGISPTQAAIALCHNPDGADKPGWGPFRGWILAGHTHGGQCKPPFLPPPILPVRNRRYVAGEIPLADGRRLYINRGLGHLLQVRFNVRPEITVFTLRSAGQE